MMQLKLTISLKMDMISRHYDQVLTFTYKYVILKNYTLIPITDTFINHNKKYIIYNYKDCFEEDLIIQLNKLKGEYKLTFLLPCFCKNFD